MIRMGYKEWGDEQMAFDEFYILPEGHWICGWPIFIWHHGKLGYQYFAGQQRYTYRS